MQDKEVLLRNSFTMLRNRSVIQHFPRTCADLPSSLLLYKYLVVQCHRIGLQEAVVHLQLKAMGKYFIRLGMYGVQQFCISLPILMLVVTSNSLYTTVLIG